MIDSGRFNPAPALLGAWDSTLLGHLSELNLRFLEQLVRASRAAANPLRTPLLSQLRADWQRLSPARLLQLAECPYLLMDAGFALPGCWGGPAADQVRDETVVIRGCGFAEVMGTDLVRRMLVLAWHLARANPLAARITLGMSDACISLIAARSIAELERLAETRPEWVRPRWEDRPEVWRQLLLAAANGPELRLRQLQLRGLQLLASGLATGRQT
jgi:hypothetical protein